MSAAVYMTALITPAAMAAPLPPPEDPTGEWMVEKGYASIRIVDCGGQYWGVVAWEKMPGNTDRNNPDPKLRSRPTLGMPVLLGMKPSKQNEWSGDIYNSQDGRTYSAKISLARPDVLRVQGCVLGFLCGGENWTRIPLENVNAAAPTPAPKGGGKGATPTPTKPATSGARSSAPRPGATTAAPAGPGESTQTSEEICSGLVGLPGGAHERRLK